MSSKKSFKEQLKEDTDYLLSEIIEREISGKSRCHEIMRLLRKDLIKKGYENPNVQDGRAIYNVSLLDELDSEWFSDFDDEPVDEKTMTVSQNGKRISVKHSWCEIGEYVIDHHNFLQPDRNTKYEMITIVESKGYLDGKINYIPCGKEFKFLKKDFLYIPPMYVTRLRL